MGTIADLNTLDTPDVADYWVVRDVSDVLDKDKKVLLGKFPLKYATPTPTAGRVVRWRDANTVEDGGIAVSDISLLSAAQSFSALKTFNAGISFGGTTLSNYETTFCVLQLFDAATGGNAAIATTTGRYTRIGNKVTLWAQLTNISTVGVTAGNAIHVRGLPFPCVTVTGFKAIGACLVSRMTFTGYVVATIDSGASYIQLFKTVSGTGVESPLLFSDIASSTFSDIYFTIDYLVS